MCLPGQSLSPSAPAFSISICCTGQCQIPIFRLVEGFEQLRAAGKIKTWGVSKFNVDQMEDLFRIPDGNRCRPLAGGINNKGSAHTAVPLGSAKPLMFTGWNEPLL